MDIEIIQVLGPWSALIVVGLVAAYVWERTHRPLKVELTLTLKGDDMAITIVPPPVEAPWITRRRNAAKGVPIMAPTKVPEDLTLFENYCTFKITDTGRYIFAAMSKSRGIVVFDTTRVLFEMPANDWGAPALDWRADGRLIVISVSQGGTMIQIDAVPGVTKGG